MLNRAKFRKLYFLLPFRRQPTPEPPVVGTWNYKLDGSWKLGEKPFYTEGVTERESIED